MDGSSLEKGTTDLSRPDALAGRKVLVMGLGRFGGGVDATRFAVKAGALVTVTDMSTEDKLAEAVNELRSQPNVELKLGCHEADDFLSADVIIVNPAVRPDHEMLQMAGEHGKRITSQIALFFLFCPARIVGITGANGKSTTTALTAHLLEHGKKSSSQATYAHVWLGGNIGHRPLLATLDQVAPEDVVVLELSSFQLEQLAQIGRAPSAALLTNLTPNHLDRHGTFEAYCAAKEAIFQFQKLDEEVPAVSIFNAADPIAMQCFRKYQGQAGRRCLTYSGDDVPESVRDRFGLPGLANLSNLAGAMTIARQFGLDDEAIADALPSFKSLPHRLEPVAEIDGVTWCNDSIATTPESVMVALDALEAPKIIIAGGYDKGVSFEELGRKIANRVKTAILIGQTAAKIAEAIAAGSEGNLKTEIVQAQSLAGAVQAARRRAVPGDVVLLSPACASYDMFQNFQQRGRQFAKLAGQTEATL